ncbi:MAG: histone deacetylase family protein [Pseudomonadota bacterium]
MNLAFITHTECMNHVMGLGHIEQPARLQAVLRAIRQDPDLACLPCLEAPRAAMDALLQIHSPSHVEWIFNHIPTGDMIAPIDGDTALSAQSGEAALRACGAAIKGVDLVIQNKARRAFALIRPPGHHAEPEKAMGFCLFNSIAIAAAYSQSRYGLERIAVLDFDVHHGNGTQKAFWNRPEWLFVSSHQMPLYPGSGHSDETGLCHNILNLPLEAGSDGTTMRRIYEQKILPRLDAFQPELLLISAGFDAHRDDPLAQLNWSSDDYRWLGERIVELGNQHCDGRVVALLEGGYDLQALGRSAVAFARALA